jgi:hypothetical protein
MGDKIWIEDPAYWGMRNTLRITVYVGGLGLNESQADIGVKA